MRKIYKLLVPAFVAVALLAAYAGTSMDDSTSAKDGAAEKVSYIPPKSSLSVPPRG